jgi:hypothetical protein
MLSPLIILRALVMAVHEAVLQAVQQAEMQSRPHWYRSHHHGRMSFAISA